MGEQWTYGINTMILDAVWLATTAILFVLWISTAIKVSKLRKRLQSFVKETGANNLDAVMETLHERTESVQMHLQRQQTTVDQMERKLAEMKGHVSVIRYNAFGDRGSDLSFSLAFVNEREDGVVLSTIHSRNESMVYAKPLEGGQSAYPLTPEEKEAISRALRPKENAVVAR